MRADWELSKVCADGVFTRAKLLEYRDQVKEERRDAACEGCQSHLKFVNSKLEDAEELLDWMEQHGSDEIEYLPANMQSVPNHLKSRAVELLLNQDIHDHGFPHEEIDQAVLDQTRQRYAGMGNVGYTLAREALDELDELASFLDLR